MATTKKPTVKDEEDGSDVKGSDIAITKEVHTSKSRTTRKMPQSAKRRSSLRNPNTWEISCLLDAAACCRMAGMSLYLILFLSEVLILSISAISSYLLDKISVKLVLFDLCSILII